eukprot:2639-Chlamydomonas_euryale.AAC.1
MQATTYAWRLPAPTLVCCHTQVGVGLPFSPFGTMPGVCLLPHLLPRANGRARRLVPHTFCIPGVYLLVASRLVARQPPLCGLPVAQGLRACRLSLSPFERVALFSKLSQRANLQPAFVCAVGAWFCEHARHVCAARQPAGAPRAAACRRARAHASARKQMRCVRRCGRGVHTQRAVVSLLR